MPSWTTTSFSQAPYAAWRSKSGAPWPFQDEFQVGCTLEHAGYYLSWLIAMFGPVERFIATSAVLIPNKFNDNASSAPDFSCAGLFFRSGMVARLTCSIVAPHNHSLRIVGDGGILEVDESWNNDAAVRVRKRYAFRRRLINGPFPSRVRLRGPTHPKVKRWGAAAMNFALGPAELLAAINEGRPCRMSAELALHLNEVSLAIQDGNGEQLMKTDCPPWSPCRGHKFDDQLSHMNDLKFAIVGTGSMAFRMMSTFAKAGVEVCAVFSTDLQRGHRFAEAFGIPAVYDNLNSLISSNIDAVYIANETAKHAVTSIAALEAGKAVLCEKPFATSSEEGKKVAATVRRTGNLFMEAIWTTFLPAYSRFFELAQIKGGDANILLTADFGYPVYKGPSQHFLEKSGGVLLDRGTYLVALALRLLGPVERVAARLVLGVGGVDQQASLLLSHRSGGTSQLCVSFVTLLSNTASLAFSDELITLEKPLIGAEVVSRCGVHPQKPASDGAPDLRSMLKRSSLLRQISRMKSSSRRQHLSYRIGRISSSASTFLRSCECGCDRKSVNSDTSFTRCARNH